MDKIAHIIGGFAIVYVTIPILKSRLTAFGTACFAIIIWEIMEFFLLPIFTYRDTILDMICGLIGAFIWVTGHWSGERWHLYRR